MNFIPLLQTAASGAGQYSFIVVISLIMLIFYFLVIRPQKKEQKQLETMIASLQKGDKIITIGGIHGVVTSTKERTLILKVDEGCKIEINKSAVGTVLRAEKKNSVKDSEAESQKGSFLGKKKNAKNSEEKENE